MSHSLSLVRRVAAAATAAALAASLSGCVRNPGDTRGDLNKYSAPVQIKSRSQTLLEEKSATSELPTASIHNSPYVSVRDAGAALGLRGQWLRDGAYGLGAEDPEWTFHVGESAARQGKRMVQMSAPAVKDGNRIYIPAKDLSALFGRKAAFRLDGDRVVASPPTVVPGAERDGRLAPSVGSETERNGRLSSSAGPGAARNGRLAPAASPGTAGDTQPFGGAERQNAGGTFRSLSAGGAKAASLIDDAKKYMGIRYDFGTGDYADTGTFDCSSFVQFLFAKYGVNLPRTARDQAELGTAVSKGQLQPGDLLFFAVPGRFSSDKTVGHVAIYMGNGNMIHSSPQPEDGVQTSDFNKDYWQQTFLFARRIPLG